MSLEILYLEDRSEARKAVAPTLAGHNVVFVSELGSLDDFLYDEEGYKYYDVIILDASMELYVHTEDELKKIIPEFAEDDFKHSVLPSKLPLWGFDYFKWVINARPQTRQMVKEGRVILFTGHASKLTQNGLFSDELFPHTPLINRGSRHAEEQLSTLLTDIQNRKKHTP